MRTALGFITLLVVALALLLLLGKEKRDQLAETRQGAYVSPEVVEILLAGEIDIPQMQGDRSDEVEDLRDVRTEVTPASFGAESWSDLVGVAVTDDSHLALRWISWALAQDPPLTTARVVSVFASDEELVLVASDGGELIIEEDPTEESGWSETILSFYPPGVEPREPDEERAAWFAPR